MPAAEVECGSCSARVPLGAAAPGARLRVTCAYCGTSHEITMPSGLETVAFPEARRGRCEDDAATASLEPSVLEPEFAPPSGTALLIPGQTLRRAAEPRQPETVRRASLVVEGPNGASMPLAGARTKVGRKGAHIVIADPTLSAVHFVIEAIGETFVIRDQGSSNGTRLNGHPIRSARLEPGDVIDAGQTRFSFRIAETIVWDRG